MRIACTGCEFVYGAQFGVCPKCRTKGGYAQSPKLKQFGNFTAHLGDLIVHKPSSNKYKIREIQNRGLIATLEYSPIVPDVAGKSLKTYISSGSLSSYCYEDDLKPDKLSSL